MRPYFVSFHQSIRLDENLPVYSGINSPDTLSLLRQARGVLLPAYVTPRRYSEITRLTHNWFPRLDARFRYQGKTAQALLFRQLGTPHPETRVFDNPASLIASFCESGAPWGYPFVLKGDSGAGGSRVFPIHSREELVLRALQLPFSEPALIQEWVNHGGRDLRVVVYGERTISYFRVGDGRFYNNLCRGGRIDHEGLPEAQARGAQAVLEFCRKTGIDIAGFDLMFQDHGEPLFIEINFHFGHKGIGGTREHHRRILQAVMDWRERSLNSDDSSRTCPA